MPPGYYAVLVVPYKLAGGSWFDRALALRFVSTLLVALAAALAWWLALGLGLSRLGALLCAGVVGLNPHAIQLAGAVNPDAAVLALWTAILLAGVRLLVDGMTPVRLAALGMLVAALLAVKPTGLAILPAALFAAGLAIRRRLDRPVRRRTGALLVVGAALLAAPLIALTTRRLERPLVSGGEDLSELPGYLVQFYTPISAFDDAHRWIAIRSLTLDHSIPASLAPALGTTLAIAAAVWLVGARAARCRVP